jgi:hypothetical protein
MAIEALISIDSAQHVAKENHSLDDQQSSALMRSGMEMPEEGRDAGPGAGAKSAHRLSVCWAVECVSAARSRCIKTPHKKRQQKHQNHGKISTNRQLTEGSDKRGFTVS